MNVQAFVMPTNIAAGLLSVDVRLRFADGTKDFRNAKIPVNFVNPLKPQIGTFLQTALTNNGHTLTAILWPDLAVTTL